MKTAWITLAATLFAVPHAVVSQQPGIEAAGDLMIRIGVARAEGGYTVATMPLETYIARVLTAEALPDSQPAALEALAIAVRTYTLANRGRHGSDGFDLCNETHCQVMRAATAATERAAAATAGLALLNAGVPASIYYSASCGGRTEVPSAVWPGTDDPPFLPSKHDDGCGGAPVWTTQLAERDLRRALRAAGFRGDRLRDLKVLSRNSSGRVARLRLGGLEPDEISGPDLRAAVGRTLGWQHIKSTAFEVKRQADGYRLSGHGSGHGVGMCVIGSARLAERGEGALDILHRYFPGLTIANPGAFAQAAAPAATATAGRTVRVAPPVAGGVPRSVATAVARSDISVTLPDGDEGERQVIGDLVVRARADLAHTLAVDLPRVTLRFHPTVDSYERATFQPWFTSGAVVGGDIHLLPTMVLRESGVLEQVIRRELVHVMTAQALGRRPIWVREGAALYFADTARRVERPNRMPVLEPRQSCPKDSDLLSPVSAGALTAAHARAQACFARQIAQGREWRDVK